MGFETDITASGDETRQKPGLDALFRRSAARMPDAPALADGGASSRLALAAAGLPAFALTYAEADALVSRLAARLSTLGLPPGAVVGVQMPNCALTVMTLLAIGRAGLTAALLPMLWRRTDMSEALGLCSPRAILVAGFGEDDDGAHHALEAAAEVFSVRHVCGFGAALADGISRLDDIFDEMADDLPATPSGTAATISFERMADRLCAVPRSDAQVIAGGLSVFLESGLAPGSSVLSTLEPMTFAALSSGVLPWLLAGGTLTCMYAAASTAIVEDVCASEADAIVLPAQLALVLGRERAARLGALKHMIALWRAPEQMTGSADWAHPRAQFTDVMAFGEAGLLSATRTAAGRPALLLPGLQSAPRFKPKATPLGEAAISKRGTLVLRGPMIVPEPYAATPLGDMPRVVPDAVDTGYRARVDARTGGIVVTSPPAGLINIGGYRFFNAEFEMTLRGASNEQQQAQLAPLPDRINGHRLVGRATDSAALRVQLGAAGANALIADAFRPRRAAP